MTKREDSREEKVALWYRRSLKSVTVDSLSIKREETLFFS